MVNFENRARKRKCNSEGCVAREGKGAREMYNYYQMGRIFLCCENNEIKDRGELAKWRKIASIVISKSTLRFPRLSPRFSRYKPLYYKIIKLLLSKITMDKKLYLFLFLMGKKKSVQLPTYRSILFNVFLIQRKGRIKTCIYATLEKIT